MTARIAITDLEALAIGRAFALCAAEAFRVDGVHPDDYLHQFVYETWAEFPHLADTDIYRAIERFS